MKNPLAYELPGGCEDTYRALELAAESLGPGSRDMVVNSLDKGDLDRAREAVVAGIEASEVQENPPIMNYGGSLSRR